MTPQLLSAALRSPGTREQAKAVQAILSALKRAGGDVGAASRALSVPRRTLDRWLATLPALSQAPRQGRQAAGQRRAKSLRRRDA